MDVTIPSFALKRSVIDGGVLSKSGTAALVCKVSIIGKAALAPLTIRDDVVTTRVSEHRTSISEALFIIIVA